MSQFEGVQRPLMLQVVDYEPVPCKSCGGVLNPYASMDFQAQIWVCPFCHQRNHVPSQYRGIDEQTLPAGHAFLPSADVYWGVSMSRHCQQLLDWALQAALVPVAEFCIAAG